MGGALKERLDGFFNQFSATSGLVEDLIRSRSHAQEILILLCSRLDALACGSAGEEEPRQKAFTRFVTAYSGRSRLFESVSVGDLYYELGYHLWLLPGMLEKAGRIRSFSRLNEPILKFLVDSEIALTQEEAENLLKRMCRTIRKHFRVAPGQPLRKRPLGSVKQIVHAVLSEFRGTRSTASKEGLSKALGPLIGWKSLGRVLYERFRCEVIHGVRVLIDEGQFFVKREPYWRPLYSEFYGSFQLVEFPAQFLAAVFSDCVRHYKKHLESAGKLPPDVHFQIFADDTFNHLGLLDESLLPRGRTALPR